MATAVEANIPNSADQNKSIRDASYDSVRMRILDISGANSDFMPVSTGGVVTSIRTAVSGDPVGATLITISNDTKSRTIGTVVVANGSTAGDSVANVDISVSAGGLDDGDVLKALSNAAATAAVSVNLSIEIDRASR